MAEYNPNMLVGAEEESYLGGHQMKRFHDHASKLLRKLNETRKNPKLCDITVLIGSSEIPAQKGVLSSASHYFSALFNYNSDSMGVTTVEEKSQSSVISLNSLGIEESTFRSVLDYIYTAQVDLNPDNIQDMLQASDQLLMEDLKDLCSEYLDSCITTNNCVGIYDFTSQLSCPWSHHKVSCFIDQNFSQVSLGEEFLSLNANRIREFLSRDTIQMKQEDDVLEALLRWYHFDAESRKEDILGLLKDVIHVKLLSGEAVEGLLALPEIGETCVKIVQGLREDVSDATFMHRGYTKVIIACGGDGQVIDDDCSSSDITDSVHCIRVDRTVSSSSLAHSPNSPWIRLASLNTARSGHGLVEVGGCLYVAGGRDQNCRILNSCEKYDPSQNKWTFIAPMNHARVGFGFVAIESNIYAIGGSNDITEPTMSMEVYSTVTERWRALPDMMMKRVWASCVASGKKIYVLGGGVVEKFYDSVEVFDTATLTWSAVSPMRERRCDAKAVATGNHIFVFGGYRRIECPSAAHSGHNLKLCGVEKYSEKNDFWMPIQSQFNSPGLCVVGERSTVYGALVDGEDILVVGELDMNGEMHTVRCYNRQLGVWDCAVSQGPPQQMHFQCCSLSLPNKLLYQLLWDQDKLQFSDIVKKN